MSSFESISQPRTAPNSKRAKPTTKDLQLVPCFTPFSLVYSGQGTVVITRATPLKWAVFRVLISVVAEPANAERPQHPTVAVLYMVNSVDAC